MECEKLATEKTEMQRHYVMYYEMSYGLNVEMHKQVRGLQKYNIRITIDVNPNVENLKCTNKYGASGFEESVDVVSVFQDVASCDNSILEPVVLKSRWEDLLKALGGLQKGP